MQLVNEIRKKELCSFGTWKWDIRTCKVSRVLNKPATARLQHWHVERRLLLVVARMEYAREIRTSFARIVILARILVS
jgi:hypothetical protein